MAKKDDLFEFNAPQYLDFTQGIPEETDDSYFELAPENPRTDSPMETEESQEPPTAEKQATVEEGPTTEEQTTEEFQEPPTEEKQGPTTEEQTTEKSQEPPTAEKQEATVEEEPTTEEQTTEGSQEPPTAEEEGATEESQEPPTVEEDGATGAPTFPASPRVLSAAKVKKMRGQSPSVGVRQSPRLLAISKALRRSAAQRTPGSPQAAGSSSSSRAKGSLVTKVQTQKRGNNRVPGVGSLTQDDKHELSTVATFRDKIHKNKRKDAHTATQPLKPTKVQEFHFATDQRLRNQAEAHPHLSSPPMPAPSRPLRSGPTRPQEFHFATDSRLKGKDAAKGEEIEPPRDFARMLRSSSSSSLDTAGTAHRGPTIPQPFHFSDSRRQHQQQAEVSQKFVSMAELNLKFILGTPERFRTKRAGSVELQESNNKKPKGLTMPHTPNLATSRRRRSLSVMTQEEREIQEFEEAQKHAFKARPVNKKVFGTPDTGYHVEKKLPTVPEPFNITESKKSECLSLVSALPYGGINTRDTARSKLQVQPFSFDQRDKAKLEQKQQKIQKIIEEEKRAAEFHARPMPVFEDGVHGVPPKKPPTPTQVKPFSMRVDQRGSTKQERFKEQLEKEAQWEAEQRRFRAQADDVVHKAPFIPEKSKKPLTEISNVPLNTEIRASERSEYENQQKAMEEERMAAKKMEEERRAAEELAEVARLRQEAVHKAQPVPKYKPMVIQPSLQPPTVPQSPNFATNTRLRSRSRANSTFSVNE
ncbi:targeting protein for Xklp2-like [Eriocheir sinensis]|uniref:targeting protein for Xklp2-like n=1 Tax=Eriocheir sinensis TaxID=95602 RepID=UPI0021CA38A0|nr:targeting protein for Xklp2-like [Eriocheir sinensis]XP_050707916.1 targeting protein for Xklp2-like [Eriocheir sinensis]